MKSGNSRGEVHGVSRKEGQRGSECALRALRALRARQERAWKKGRCKAKCGERGEVRQVNQNLGRAKLGAFWHFVEGTVDPCNMPCT